MRLSEIIKSAFASIWSMKVRSFLTSLGVIIGVFAIAALLSIGNSVAIQMQQSMEGLNANIITSGVYREAEEILKEDLAVIQNENDSLAAVAPNMQSNATIVNGSNIVSVPVVGTTFEYAQVNDYNLMSGRFLMPMDISAENKVVVLGFTMAIKLFGNTDIFGEKVKMNNHTFTVVGVIEKQAETWMGNPNEQVMIPYTTGQKLFEMGQITSLTALAASDEAIDEATTVIRTLMLQKTDNDSNAFYVYTASQTQEVMAEMNTSLMALLGGIGGISLLISGIGIMNIMLVSVRERTREIGIRKAIGAKRKDILIQFLVESVVLSGIGGVIGILLTFVLSRPVGSFMQQEIALTGGIVLLSLTFSLVAGIVFGLYPAAKASKLRPIEALRYE